MGLRIENEIIRKNAERQRKVLCIDDDAINRMVIGHILGPLGFQFDMADSGTAGLELLKQNTYELILLDILMPGLNGFETAEAIRKMLPNYLPIIFISAGIHDDLDEQMKKNNILSFIPKPIEKNYLQKVISEVL